jgi:hypothetical protein
MPAVSSLRLEAHRQAIFQVMLELSGNAVTRPLARNRSRFWPATVLVSLTYLFSHPKMAGPCLAPIHSLAKPSHTIESSTSWVEAGWVWSTGPKTLSSTDMLR